MYHRMFTYIHHCGVYHLVSPGSISSIDRKNVGDFPGDLPSLFTFWIMSDQAALGDLMLCDISNSTSTCVIYSVPYSTNLCCMGRRPFASENNGRMLICPIEAISSLETFSRGTDVVPLLTHSPKFTHLTNLGMRKCIQTAKSLAIWNEMKTHKMAAAELPVISTDFCGQKQ